MKTCSRERFQSTGILCVLCLADGSAFAARGWAGLSSTPREETWITNGVGLCHRPYDGYDLHWRGVYLCGSRIQVLACRLTW